MRAVVAERGVDIEFSVGAGEVVAVLGPNGAGKSTALHLIAGLLRPDDGVVRLGDNPLTDTAAGVFVPAHKRRVGMLMQDPLLFPHLSVAANVAFAPRSRGQGRRRAREAAALWLRRVDAADLADRSPAQLSGGQAQRVALARALAARPDVMLLDEPLSGLDVAAAAAIRNLLRGVLAADGRSAVLVTHELLDVLTLADRVLVLESGRVAEIGSAATVLAAPRSHFAARIAGINLVNGTLEQDGVLRTHRDVRWHGVPSSDTPPEPGRPAVAVFAPAAAAVYRDAPRGSPRNTVAVTLAEVDSRGAGIRVRGEEQDDGAPGLAADITVDAATELRLAPGEQVYFSVKAQEVALYAGLGKKVTE
ncbi:sulfate/molybdate ABC transporter ATP-binding protein [Mycobacterium sp.]|uniref:sulfate/molybdate ABC transporter ATP-binding protein n=1 Tax=Mycobacterium sp. TaxID=1785 RepID=UPI002D4AEB21|nr:ATP-binding cassette domain-containing protein [Mycobacterium sp.]HZA09637.1 ATP-binding cassette domain-containing protein [Mycobacterium sp.]